MDINFEMYKFFYLAAKLSSFSAAAEELFVSQSAVSQAIKKLESRFGTQLFVRKNRKIFLTHEGEILFKYIEQAYNFITVAEKKINEMQSLASGEIRIGVSDTICKYFLVSYLETFYSRYPGIKIHIVNRTSSQIVKILKDGLIDLGIISLPHEDRAVSIEVFREVQDIFVASPKFSALKESPIALGDLRQYPVLMLQKSSTARQNMDRFLELKGISLAPEIEFESNDLLVMFAKIGFGLAFVLKDSVSDLINNGELFEVKFKEQLPARELGIATLSHVPLSRASTEFIKFLREDENLKQVSQVKIAGQGE